MIELQIKEAQRRERARAEEWARQERERIAGLLVEWLGEEALEALHPQAHPTAWYITLTLRSRRLRLPRRIEVLGDPWNREHVLRAVRVRRHGSYWGVSVNTKEAFLVVLGELQ